MLIFLKGVNPPIPCPIISKHSSFLQPVHLQSRMSYKKTFFQNGINKRCQSRRFQGIIERAKTCKLLVLLPAQFKNLN